MVINNVQNVSNRTDFFEFYSLPFDCLFAAFIRLQMEKALDALVCLLVFTQPIKMNVVIFHFIFFSDDGEYKIKTAAAKRLCQHSSFQMVSDVTVAVFVCAVELVVIWQKNETPNA